VATYRAIAKKYPELEPQRLLHDLIESTPGEEGKWFATAKALGQFDLALELAWHSPCDPKKLTRAARDHLRKHPTFAVEAALAALHWIAQGAGYALTGLDVLEAYRYATEAAVIRRRIPKAEFRERVIDAYRQQCALCRLKHDVLLDAAHTTHDELFRDVDLLDAASPVATKEVARYRQALKGGFERVNQSGLITNNDILRIQEALEQNQAGFHKLPGTALKDGRGKTVHMPPQDPAEVLKLMGELERFINADEPFAADPLIKKALIHHQFETIHPFYDGNGRTGRIVNVLYLVKERLLDIPVLCMSRHIVRTKSDYYRLLQEVRDHGRWEDWVLYMLTAVETTGADGVSTVQAIKAVLLDYKHRIREQHRKFYSQDLINNLFSHPYAKIEYIEHDLQVSRLTTSKYLEALTASGFLHKQKIGRTNYYVNRPLYDILAGDAMRGEG
jgi:Fic family protein